MKTRTNESMNLFDIECHDNSTIVKVMKFGGTSVGSVDRIKHVANLITQQNEPVFVVLSAMSGTTNTLLNISSLIKNGDVQGALKEMTLLENTYRKHSEMLLYDDNLRSQAWQILDISFQLINQFISKQGAICIETQEDLIQNVERFDTNCNEQDIEKIIVAQGEKLSTTLMYYYLLSQNQDVSLLDALDFMRIDENLEPNCDYIKEKLLSLVNANLKSKIYLTQGFICRDNKGIISNLKRGGSDYTASLIGAALDVKEIQIWTDIDGLHNNDPRYVDNTSPVRSLSFDEAAELAYFGAKILHPTCVLPAKSANIPVRLLNTMDPCAFGTVISNSSDSGKIKAIAAKDGITCISVHSSRMLLATGFLRRIFEIFDVYHTSVDLVTTSEVGVSMSVDCSSQEMISLIVNDLNRLGEVSVYTDLCIVCIVGDFGFHRFDMLSVICSAFSDISVRMVSYGGSPHNISFLIKEEDKQKALQTLSKLLFS